MTLQELLKYAASGKGLITTATPYFKQLKTCIADSCPAASLVGDADWEKVLEEASERLTYSDPLGLVDTESVKALSDDGWGDDLADEEVPAKSIMVFDSVLSTSDTDREGDILYTDGMELEKSMPVLWQHIWHQPIGVQIRTLEQNTSRVVVREAIGDTPLGKDASVLIGMGAMRKSHGFLPIPGEITLLGVKKEGDQPTGFGIKRCQVYESSVVSVPANAGAQVLTAWEKEFDGICRAFSEKKLSTDMCNKWAEHLYEKRTKVFAGATPEPEATPPEACCTTAVTDTPSEGVAELEPFRVAKSLTTSGEKMLSMASPDYLPGSYEEVQCKIYDQAKKKLLEKMSGREWDYSVWVASTFAETAVVCCRDWDKDETKCYECSWSRDNGEIVLDDEMTEVEIRAEVVAKSLSGITRPTAPEVTPEPTAEPEPAQTKQFQPPLDPLASLLQSLV